MYIPQSTPVVAQADPRGGWTPPEPTETKGVKSLIERVTEAMPPGGYANDAELTRAHQVALRQLVKDQGKDPDSPQAQQWMFQQLQTVADPANPKGKTVRTLLLRPVPEAKQYIHTKDGALLDPFTMEVKYKPEAKDETPEPVKTANWEEYKAHQQALAEGEKAQAAGGQFEPAYMEAWRSSTSPTAMQQAKQKADAAKADREARKLAMEEQQAKSKEALTQSAVSLNVAKADELANKLPDAKRLEYDTHRDELRGLVNERVRASADPMMDDVQRAAKVSAIDNAIRAKHTAINELLKQPEAKGLETKPATKKLDADTARTFLHQAGGDKAKARQLAKDAGYEF